MPIKTVNILKQLTLNYRQEELWLILLEFFQLALNYNCEQQHNTTIIRYFTF